MVTPLFKKLVVTPIMKFFPWGIPANIITIVSNLFLYIAVFFAYNPPADGKAHFIIIPVLIFLYALGDHMDGMQAKRTGTGSALGEFCDHYLDILNNGLLLLILVILFNITNPFLLGAAFFVAYLSHSTVIYEEFKTKWLIFEKFGSLETVFLVMLLVFLGYFPAVFSFLTDSANFLFTPMEYIVMISLVGALFTVLKAALRVRKSIGNAGLFQPGYICFLVCVFVLCVFVSYFQFYPHVVFLMIGLYSATYIGGLMRGHLADGIERFPDFIAPIIVMLTFLYALTNGRHFKVDNFDGATQIAIFLTIYLLILNVTLVARTFITLKELWVWWNPAKNN
jgi:ethanolaminephosphotransferase